MERLSVQFCWCSTLRCPQKSWIDSKLALVDSTCRAVQIIYFNRSEFRSHYYHFRLTSSPDCGPLKPLGSFTFQHKASSELCRHYQIPLAHHHVNNSVWWMCQRRRPQGGIIYYSYQLSETNFVKYTLRTGRRLIFFVEPLVPLGPLAPSK